MTLESFACGGDAMAMESGWSRRVPQDPGARQRRHRVPRRAGAALAALARADDELDQAALDGDVRAAHAAGTILAVAKGTSRARTSKKAIAAVGGMSSS